MKTLTNYVISGPKLREARKTQYPGYSCAAVARIADTTRQSIENIDSGRYQPSGRMLIKLLITYCVYDLRDVCEVAPVACEKKG